MPNEVHGSTVHGDIIQAENLYLHGNEKPHPPLTSWHDRPALTAELEDLLHVQREAAETLPYRLLGVRQPELTRVYVQQSVRETDRKQGDRPLPIGEALARGKHLLITGEPGAGKSTLGQMYVQRLATEWLEASADPPLPEPVMPLRIPAKALADDLPWSELLANAVRDRRLNATLKPELFAKRALGARWLVFVDGLDEIAEPERRDRVIDALVSRMRRGSDHRLVITTRPLPPDELQKLHGQDIDLFTIQPFGPMELQDFASAWFRAQNPTNSKDRAAEFVSQVHDGRLRELVRNPLLATIAAIANTLEPHRKLPHNRADLYERFMSYLLDDRASGRTTLAELRKAHADDPARVEQIEWLYERRKELIEHLAVQRLESESPLLDEAVQWVGTAVDDDDLLAVLASTGVFVHGEGGLKFLHHSFAEFLAARLRARSIPADFPKLDEWVELGTLPAREASVLFTFALWGREDSHDLDLVMARLLKGGAKHALLAGRLLAEDVAITSSVREVVDRLVQLMLTNGVKDVPWYETRETSRVLAGLDNEPIAGLITSELRRLRDNADLPRAVRIACAVALGHLDSPEAAADWLQEYADVRCTDALSTIAIGLAEILPNGAALAEDLVLRLVATTDSYTVRMAVADILVFDLERRDAAARLLRDLVRRLRADPSIEPGTTHIPHFGALADAAPYLWVYLVHLATAAGCDEEAVWAAEQVLAQSSVEPDAFEIAVDVLLKDGSGDAAKRIRARAVELTLEHVLIVAERTYPLTDLNKFVVEHPAATDDQRVRALRLGYVGPDMHEWVLHRHSLMPNHLIALARPEGNDDLIDRALLTPTGDKHELRRVMRGAMSLANGVAVFSAAREGSPLQRAMAAAVLYNGNDTDILLSAELVKSLMTDPLNAEAAVVCLDEMVTVEVPEHARELFDRLSDAVGRNHPEVARNFAAILHRIGRSDEAARLAVDTFLRARHDEMLDCVGTILDVSGAQHADLIVAKVRETGLNVWQRMDIADLFVNEGLLDQAVEMWLDVVRDHAEVIDKGIDAAAKLVKVGRRAQALGTVRTALEGDPLTSTARRNMTALLAWLQA
jgi:hypothetical protein